VSSFELERKSIHELANHMTIIHGSVKKVLKDLQSDQTQKDSVERLQKADEYLKKSLVSLRELRTAIHEKMEIVDE
jgi:hypothetical protein